MKALAFVALAGAASCLSSCSTGARSLQSLSRSGEVVNRSLTNFDDAALRSQGTILRTGDTAARSYNNYERAKANAPATAARTTGTINRLFESIGRSLNY
ncbi:MAG: hypothetical protein ACQKBU_01485 [Verrucomicrobiales bacterium]